MTYNHMYSSKNKITSCNSVMHKRMILLIITEFQTVSFQVYLTNTFFVCYINKYICIKMKKKTLIITLQQFAFQDDWKNSERCPRLVDDNGVEN